MMSDVFSIQVLTEKLTNLNNSQQSIESLSQWCILHRKKAKQVVETWDKMFNSFPKEKRVPLLYLANDILQNSRRNGTEFVSEFWKVLPGALKSIYESGDDREKTVVMRLVDIWEERKVFGSRGRVLKNEMLGSDTINSVDSNGKGSQVIKIVKKDAHSIRIKLAVGCMPERILSAFRLVHDEQSSEENILNMSKATVDQVGKLEKDIDSFFAQGNQHSAVSISEFIEKETVLKKCIEQLETLEATRASLVSYLKEALLEEESKWGDVHHQLQVAKAEAAHMASLRHKLTSATIVSSSTIPAILSEAKVVSDAGLPNHVGNQVIQLPAQSTVAVNSFHTAGADSGSLNHVGNPMMVPSTQSTTFAKSTTSAEDQNKKTAAAVAAKLASMTSSAQVLTSVLSTLVAEEAASMSGGLKIGNFATGSTLFPPEKRPKLERPMQVSDPSNGRMAHASQQPSSIPQAPAPPVNTSQPAANMPQHIFPPLPPTAPSPLPQVSTFGAQSTGGISGGMPFNFGGGSVPMPPPPSVLLGLSRSAPQSVAPPIPLQPPQPMQQPQQQMPPPVLPLPPPPQQQSTPAVFFPTPFYGQPPSVSMGAPQAHQR